ncbi:hypothetical protein JTB14_017750 [Gonioctena quinquepunctata]|nr:hypothetical protein JTB14_017750 [Gonioctena quinquepunctata]
MHLEQVSESHQARVGDAEPLINKEDNASVVQTTTCNLSMSTQQVILSTAIVLVKDKNDQFHEARVFLDSGSQSNFITRELCNKLSLPMKQVDFSVEGVGQLLCTIDHSTTVSLRAKLKTIRLIFHV